MKLKDIVSGAVTAAVAIPFAVILHAPLAIADSNQEGSIKPTKKAFKTMLGQFNSIISYDGSLKAYDRVPVPKIDFLIGENRRFVSPDATSP